MVFHQCNRCNIIFKKKSHLIQHLNKKNICEDIKHKNYLNNTKMHINTHQMHMFTQNIQNNQAIISDINNIINDENKDIKEYKCEYCNQNYSRSDALKRHIDNYCKVKKKLDKEKDDEKNKLLNQNKELEKKLIETTNKLIKYEDNSIYDELFSTLATKNIIIDEYKNEIIEIKNNNKKVQSGKNIIINDDDDDDDDDNEKNKIIKYDNCNINYYNNDINYNNNDINYYDGGNNEKYNNNQNVIQKPLTLNNMVIIHRPEDNFINATQLCQAGNKKFYEWFRLETTKNIINTFCAEAGIPASANDAHFKHFIEINKGGNDKLNQGTWIHPDLAIQLAQWISPIFALQVSKWIRELLTQGKVEINMMLKNKDREIKIKDQKIKILQEKTLRRQKREVFTDKNVLYLLTTEENKKRNIYIFGKAKNLTERLSTYNKTCEHEVIYQRGCYNEEDMKVIEDMALRKLDSYRDKINRDRFTLPKNEKISLFTDIIDKCIDFMYN